MPTIWDWSTTAGNNATADADINWSEGQFPSTVNDSARQMMGRQAEWLKDNGVLTAAGSANAITVATNSQVTSPPHGMTIAFRAAATNTGAVTLSINGGAGLPVRKPKDGSTNVVDLDGKDILQGGVFVVHYDSAANAGVGAWVIVNPINAALFLGVTGGIVTGPVDIDGLVTTGGSIEVGGRRTSAGSSFIDLHSEFPLTDYDARIIRNPGANSTLDIVNTGTGGIKLGPLTVATSGKISNAATPTGANDVATKGYADTKITADAAPQAGFVAQDQNNPYIMHSNGTIVQLQRLLGFTPVRQGGGPGQTNDVVNIGYGASSEGIRIAINGFDQGTIVTSQNINANVAGMGAGSIGSYALCYFSGTGSISVGGTIGGGSLSWSSAWGNSNIGAPAGSWRCMGWADSNSQNGRVTLFQRYA
ncbi:hypothetical protein QQF51_12680 [Brucella intermedia]|uniref:hypothetical protein n=1 Tax=Brucella intermedia TaxID=94625 RepID=UPI002553470A|nr:hypothetical protein [Brucella intermedia]MDL2203513.1 hypothetical protein [Brucella intermedia]